MVSRFSVDTVLILILIVHFYSTCVTDFDTLVGRIVLYLLVFVVFLFADPDWLQPERQWSLLQRNLSLHASLCSIFQCIISREINMHRPLEGSKTSSFCFACSLTPAKPVKRIPAGLL